MNNNINQNLIFVKKQPDNNNSSLLAMAKYEVLNNPNLYILILHDPIFPIFNPNSDNYQVFICHKLKVMTNIASSVPGIYASLKTIQEAENTVLNYLTSHSFKLIDDNLLLYT
jgi:hypothetical protein